MSQSPGASPQAGPAGRAPEPADPGSSGPHGTDPAATEAAQEHPHNFAVQKEVHRQIRNDPDYDDWEYGTEPLPSEAWSARAQAPD